MSDKNAEGFMMIEGLPESVGTEESVFEKEIWNKAIETCYSMSQCYNSELAEGIRRLKK